MKEYVNICATQKYYNATLLHLVAKYFRILHQRAFNTETQLVCDSNDLPPLQLTFPYSTTHNILLTNSAITEALLQPFCSCLLHIEHYYLSR